MALDSNLTGFGGVIAEVDGTTFRAVRFVAKPPDHGALGAYRWGGFTGIIPAALAANSEIFQFRWTDASKLCIVRRIRISAAVTTTFFAAGVPVQIDLVKATSWSAQGTGGTGVTPSATLKRRTSMGSTLVASGDMRIATTAALGAGTKTLEANSLAALAAAGPITASLNGSIIAPWTELYAADVAAGDHPLVLVTNEGLVIRSVAVPATGTWTAAIDIDWSEHVAY
jgi:hypothetical protein